jgi:hypothetical protein
MNERMHDMVGFPKIQNNQQASAQAPQAEGFDLACGGASTPGTVVLGVGYNVNNEEEMQDVLQQAREDNRGQPLNEVVVDYFGRLRMNEIPEFATGLTEGDNRTLNEGGTLSFVERGLTEDEEFQEAANQSNLRIVVGDPASNSVTVFEKDKPQSVQQNMVVGNGGLGMRGGCGDPPGLRPAQTSGIM